MALFGHDLAARQTATPHDVTERLYLTSPFETRRHGACETRHGGDAPRSLTQRHGFTGPGGSWRDAAERRSRT